MCSIDAKEIQRIRYWLFLIDIAILLDALKLNQYFSNNFVWQNESNNE